MHFAPILGENLFKRLESIVVDQHCQKVADQRNTAHARIDVVQDAHLHLVGTAGLLSTSRISALPFHVTAKSSSCDRRRGVELGALYYIGKGAGISGSVDRH